MSSTFIGRASRGAASLCASRSKAAGAAYVDVARERAAGRGVRGMTAMLEGGAPQAPFAPPFLRAGEIVVSHVANILQHYLGPKLELAPKDEGRPRIFAHGLQLTITDFMAEVHDTHHPIATNLYYEDQRHEAKARTSAFLQHRAPKYLGYLERVLSATTRRAKSTWWATHSRPSIYRCFRFGKARLTPFRMPSRTRANSIPRSRR